MPTPRAFIDQNVPLGKWAIFNLSGAASALNFTASCAKSMFKAKLNICLKNAYMAGNRKKVKKNLRAKTS